MVANTGVEPVPACVWGSRLNRLTYLHGGFTWGRARLYRASTDCSYRLSYKPIYKRRMSVYGGQGQYRADLVGFSVPYTSIYVTCPYETPKLMGVFLLFMYYFHQRIARNNRMRIYVYRGRLVKCDCYGLQFRMSVKRLLDWGICLSKCLSLCQFA